VPAAWAADALLIVVRWVHGLAAVVFLGWTLVLLAGRPASGDDSIVRRYKDVVEITLVVFLASGALLAFDRLSQGAGTLYAGLLVLKLALSVTAFQLAFQWRRRGLVPDSPHGRLVLGFGAAAVLVAAAMLEVFEYGLRSQL
jgi:hypothetical protein